MTTLKNPLFKGFLVFSISFFFCFLFLQHKKHYKSGENSQKNLDQFLTYNLEQF